METKLIEVKHHIMVLSSTFEDFTTNMEALLGRLNIPVFEKMEEDPAFVEQELKKMGGFENLILFNIYEHGKLLNIAGLKIKLKHYVIGNPLIASMMTRHDRRAGLYAPLHLLVYLGEDLKLYLEYDQPSSLFGQFDNEDVKKIGESLDEKFANLISKADSL